MKRNLIFPLSVAFIFMACHNDSKKSAPDPHDPSTAIHHTDTAINTAGSNQKDMMQIMMQMDSAMKNARLKGDADHDFALMMKVHHQSAVEMAELEVVHGTDTAIKKMAQKMITDQHKEIAAFDQYIQSNKAGRQSEAFKIDLLASLKEMDHSQHGSGSIDQQFVFMMIPHHQSAIDMAKPYLQYATDPVLKAIAQNIISSQQAEIKQLESLQKKEHQH